MDFIESCRKLISLDTSPSQGNYFAAQFLIELGESLGLKVEKFAETSGDLKQMNLLIRPEAQAGDVELLLQTHLDTPDPGPFGLWKMTGSNPFDAHIIDGRIFGLGAADSKLDFLCKLQAMGQMAKTKTYKVAPVLAATYGEESGMTGALKLIRKNKIKAKYALIGEPSDLQLVTSGKGLATVEIRVPFSEHEKKYRVAHNFQESTSTVTKVFNGKSAHSSTPNQGESAIKKLFQYLMQLPEDISIMDIDGGVNSNSVPANAVLELDFVSGQRMSMAQKLVSIYQRICDLEDEFLQYQDEEFQPSYPTLNIGTLRTQESWVDIAGTCRFPPSVSQEVYEKWMKDLAEACQQVSADFRIVDYKKPFRGKIDSDFVRICQAELRNLKLSQHIVTTPSTTEASLFARLGIECVCFGPGKREGNIHTPNENVEIADLEKAIQFYTAVIQRVCA